MNEIAPVNSTALMSFIERAAINPDFDVQKFGELLRMQREMEHDQFRRAFNQAMASAQALMPPVVRSATNKHLGNKYAKLEDVDREMRPIYTENGFRFALDQPRQPKATSASHAPWRTRPATLRRTTWTRRPTTLARRAAARLRLACRR